MDKATSLIFKSFVKKLCKSYPKAKIFLFGSRARGDNFISSDFDIMIVSDKFKDKKFNMRLREIYNFWNYKYDLEPICYTEKEFQERKNKPGIVKQALKEGIKISL